MAPLRLEKNTTSSSTNEVTSHSSSQQTASSQGPTHLSSNHRSNSTNIQSNMTSACWCPVSPLIPPPSQNRSLADRPKSHESRPDRFGYASQRPSPRFAGEDQRPRQRTVREREQPLRAVEWKKEEEKLYLIRLSFLPSNKSSCSSFVANRPVPSTTGYEST